jgi:hypothetical protein
MTSPNPDWSSLRDAYGPAGKLPAVLAAASQDLRGGHDSQSPWFQLWSALCHQGDVYSASYAALPILVAIAEERIGSPHQFDPLFLVACIELSRLEGRGPPLPTPLEGAYKEATRRASALTSQALLDPLYARFPDYREGLEAGLLALRGDAVEARRLLDADLEAEGDAE